MANRRSLQTPSTGGSAPVRSAAARTPRKSAESVSPARPVAAEARRAMIAERAYLRAEKRGFTSGHETEDWLAAEVEIDLLLKASHGGSSQ
jgi:hypothetical protein